MSTREHEGRAWISRRALLVGLASLPLGTARAGAGIPRLSGWRPGPRLLAPIARPAVHPLPEGRALVAGVGPVALLRPGAMHVHAVAHSPAARWVAASCLLGSGRLLMWACTGVGFDGPSMTATWSRRDGWVVSDPPAAAGVLLTLAPPSIAPLPNDEALLLRPAPERLDPPEVYRWTGLWSPAPAPARPHPLARLVALPSGRVALVDCLSGQAGWTRTVEIFDSEDGRWREVGAFEDGSSLRQLAATTTGKAVVVERREAGMVGLVIDLETGVARTIPMATDLGWQATTGLGDCIIAAGGAASAGAEGTEEVWLFDSRSDEWLPGPALPVRSRDGTLVVVGRHLILAGGRRRGEETDETWVCDWSG